MQRVELLPYSCLRYRHVKFSVSSFFKVLQLIWLFTSKLRNSIFPFLPRSKARCFPRLSAGESDKASLVVW